MPAQKVPRVQRADARATHAALLEAATAIAARAAPELPYDEIALTAGVGRATVYRHFPTREALAQAIIESSLTRWEATVAALPMGPDHLEHVLQAWVHLQQDHTHAVDLLACSAEETVRRQARRRLEDSLREPLREAQRHDRARAELTARDVRIVFTMLGSALRFTQPAGDRRRAIEITRGMLSGHPGPPSPAAAGGQA